MLSGLKSMSVIATRDEISRPVTSQIVANGVVRGEPKPGQRGLLEVHFWDGALAAFLTYMLLLHHRFSKYYPTIVLCWFFSSRLLAALFNFYLPYVAVGVLTEALALFLIAAESRYHPSKRLSLIFFVLLSIQNESIT